MKDNTLREVLDYVKLIAIVAAVVFVVNTFIIINARIPSASMETTIMTGDRVFGNRLAYGFNVDLGPIHFSKQWAEPKRYDIIIFQYPDDESKLYIKRLIGLPGETVTIDNGTVTVTTTDGETIVTDDSFINGEMESKGDGVYQVPEGCYFMLGDNRNNSADSRFWTNKYVRFDQIVGKAVLRYWPLTKIKLLGYKGGE